MTGTIRKARRRKAKGNKHLRMKNYQRQTNADLNALAMAQGGEPRHTQPKMPHTGPGRPQTTPNQ